MYQSIYTIRLEMSFIIDILYLDSNLSLFTYFGKMTFLYSCIFLLIEFEKNFWSAKMHLFPHLTSYFFIFWMQCYSRPDVTDGHNILFFLNEYAGQVFSLSFLHKWLFLFQKKPEFDIFRVQFHVTLFECMKKI